MTKQSIRALDGAARVPPACFFAVPLYAGLILVLHEPMTVLLTTAAVFAASLLSGLAGFAFLSYVGRCCPDSATIRSSSCR